MLIQSDNIVHYHYHAKIQVDNLEKNIEFIRKTLTSLQMPISCLDQLSIYKTAIGKSHYLE